MQKARTQVRASVGPTYCGRVSAKPQGKTLLSITDYGEDPVWLNDNCRLLFVAADKLLLLDTVTKRAKEILSVSPNNPLPFHLITVRSIST
jgi:hypothetical protein